jgi:multiple sugar transport system permease protein
MFLTPAFVLVLGMLVYPLGCAVYFSFTNKQMTRPAYGFVGWSNYSALAHDPEFWQALWHSVLFTAATGILTLALGGMLALLLTQRFRMRGVFRSLLLVPWVMPPIVTGLMFRWLYNDYYGWVNHVLQQLHLASEPVLFLVSKQWVWPVLVTANVWIEYPFVMLMLLAALQSINPDLYRAARVDGARAFQRFRHITLPGVKKALMLNGLMQVIFMFKSFDLVWIITKGGPGTATETLATFSYQHAFEGYETGYGSAAASIIFLILFVASLVYLSIPATRTEVAR